MKDILGREAKAGDLVLRLTNNASGCEYYGLVVGNNSLVIGDFEIISNNEPAFQKGSCRDLVVYEGSSIYKIDNPNSMELSIIRQLSLEYNNSSLRKAQTIAAENKLAKTIIPGDVFILSKKYEGDITNYVTLLYLGRGTLKKRTTNADFIYTGHLYLKLNAGYRKLLIKYKVLPWDLGSVSQYMDRGSDMLSFYCVEKTTFSCVYKKIGHLIVPDELFMDYKHYVDSVYERYRWEFSFRHKN